MAESRSHLREAIGPKDPVVGHHLNQLGVLQGNLNRFDEAEQTHRLALEVLEKEGKSPGRHLPEPEQPGLGAGAQERRAGSRGNLPAKPRPGGRSLGRGRSRLLPTLGNLGALLLHFKRDCAAAEVYCRGGSCKSWKRCSAKRVRIWWIAWKDCASRWQARKLRRGQNCGAPGDRPEGARARHGTPRGGGGQGANGADPVLCITTRWRTRRRGNGKRWR